MFFVPLFGLWRFITVSWYNRSMYNVWRLKHYCFWHMCAFGTKWQYLWRLCLLWKAEKRVFFFLLFFGIRRINILPMCYAAHFSSIQLFRSLIVSFEADFLNGINDTVDCHKKSQCCSNYPMSLISKFVLKIWW